MFWEGDRLPRKSTNLRFINPSTMPSSSETSQGRFHHTPSVVAHLESCVTTCFPHHLERLFNVESPTKDKDDGFCPVKIHPESSKGFGLIIHWKVMSFPSNFPNFFVAIFFYLQIFEKPIPNFFKEPSPSKKLEGRHLQPSQLAACLMKPSGTDLDSCTLPPPFCLDFSLGFFVPTWMMGMTPFPPQGNISSVYPVYPPNPGCNRHKWRI